MRSLVPTESQEAETLAQYLLLMQRTGKILLYSHIPNETYTQSWSTKKRNKREGVTKGVPDYIIVTDKKVLFIELKRPKGSVTSFEQKEWIDNLSGKKTQAVVCKGWNTAKEFIEENL